MELKKGERMEKGVEAAMQELLCALSLNIIRVRRGSVCVCVQSCVSVCVRCGWKLMVWLVNVLQVCVCM